MKLPLLYWERFGSLVLSKTFKKSLLLFFQLKFNYRILKPTLTDEKLLMGSALPFGHYVAVNSIDSIDFAVSKFKNLVSILPVYRQIDKQKKTGPAFASRKHLENQSALFVLWINSNFSSSQLLRFSIVTWVVTDHWLVYPTQETEARISSGKLENPQFSFLMLPFYSDFMSSGHCPLLWQIQKSNACQNRVEKNCCSGIWSRTRLDGRGKEKPYIGRPHWGLLNEFGQPRITIITYFLSALLDEPTNERLMFL